jgi:hypothetical protein
LILIRQASLKGKFLLKHTSPHLHHLFTCLFGGQVDWLMDGEELSYLGPRPGVSLVTDKGERTVVSLILAGARTNDSGSYLCRPLQRGGRPLPQANISVHVIEGANMDQLSVAPATGAWVSMLVMLGLLLCLGTGQWQVASGVEARGSEGPTLGL